ncbi:ABC transporter permease [Marinococcus halophilus]|uniref:ABC transporter permease n=1 Tax=Marinococcus halophilus TaxID=1371 RepID=UPI0009A63B6F|nr:ABC transporter permease [Marinococcus halophilus]
MAISRMYAIFRKDVKDLSKNLLVMTTAIMPILLALFYGQQDQLPLEGHYLVYNMAFVFVATFVQAALIAEEKEKHTLRGLMLSPATPWDILVGKNLLTFLFTTITLALCMVLSGYQPADMGIVAVAMGLSVGFYLALGTFLGLLTTSVVQASIALLPVMFVFGFSSMIEQIADRYAMLSFLEYLPNVQLVEVARHVEQSGAWGDAVVPLLWIMGWTAVLWFIAGVTYQKRQLED